MAPKHHPAPPSGGDRKALQKELVKSRAMTGIQAEQSAGNRRVGEALIREATGCRAKAGTKGCGTTAGQSAD
jgi:hypothetical protein